MTSRESPYPPGSAAFPHRDLVGIDVLQPHEILFLLDEAAQWVELGRRPTKHDDRLAGLTIINAFFENSTRTLLSFEIAGKRLGADVVNMHAAQSSIKKGETLIDTAMTLNAMHADAIVIRHGSSGAVQLIADKVDCPVLNAGDGQHEHPTQALHDALTISDVFDRTDGLNVSILGDVTHSRVARSNIHALRKLGANVTLCGPPTLMPRGIEEMGVRVTSRLDEALEGCDVAMALRIQLERQGVPFFPSLREYNQLFGIKMEHMRRYPDLRIMHPGPVNRGVELDSEVVDHERAVILDQVTNGVAVRMAALYLLAGPREDESQSAD